MCIKPFGPDAFTDLPQGLDKETPLWFYTTQNLESQRAKELINQTN
jgi:hypothetical protein